MKTTVFHKIMRVNILPMNDNVESIGLYINKPYIFHNSY